MNAPAESPDITALLKIMAHLRHPTQGCSWDRQQTFSTIAPYTLEEAHEVADAIARGDFQDLKDELGDLLLQVVFHARMAEEQALFAFNDVVAAICDKMIRRHPHIFGSPCADATQAAPRDWEAIKQAERSARGDTDTSALAGIARGLPEWQRALKLQARAARVGFDWPGPAPVIDKLHEEIAEIQAELAIQPPQPERLEDELGDLLFVAANLARHTGIDPGTALRRANLKFERRFRAMETLAAQQQQTLGQLSLDQQEALWQQVKQHERTPAKI